MKSCCANGWRSRLFRGQKNRFGMLPSVAPEVPKKWARNQMILKGAMTRRAMTCARKHHGRRPLAPMQVERRPLAPAQTGSSPNEAAGCRCYLGKHGRPSMSNKLWQRCHAASDIWICTMLCLVAPHCWMLQKMSFPDETSFQPCGPSMGHWARSYGLCLKRMYADA